MKREIKFKAKRVENGEWVEGYYMMDELNKSLIIYDNSTLSSKLFCEVHTNTVCQFTGFKDMKGVDIYDGDILSNSSGYLHWKIFMHEKLLCYYSELVKPLYDLEETETCPLTELNLNYFKVIGNIHDKPTNIIP